MFCANVLLVNRKRLPKRFSPIINVNDVNESKIIHGFIESSLKGNTPNTAESGKVKQQRKSPWFVLRLHNMKRKTVKLLKKFKIGSKKRVLSKKKCEDINNCLTSIDALESFSVEEVFSGDSSLRSSCTTLSRSALKTLAGPLRLDLLDVDYYHRDVLGTSMDWSKDSVFGQDSDEEDEYFSAVCTRSVSLSSITPSPSCENKDDQIPCCGNKDGLFRFEGVNLFLAHGYKPRELLDLGCSAKDLVSAGCGVEELIEAGCSIQDLVESGSKIHELLRVLDEKGVLNSDEVRSLVWNNSKIEDLLQQEPGARERLIARKERGEDLYPACDVSVWFRTCRKEILEPLEGVVTGIVPDWIQGSLLRNGPGSLEVGEDKFQHLFDGSSLIHRFEIKNGKVTYQCKFLETNTYKKNRAAQRIVVTEFGTAGVPDPCKSIFERFSVLFNPGEMSDNAMISIYPFGDELYAFAETSVIHRIDSETLDTLERVNISEHVNIVNHTSHPHVMNDGTVFNVGIGFNCCGPCFNIVKFPPPSQIADGKTAFDKAKVVGSVSARWKLNPSYMHTFGITDNFFIIVEQPLSISFTSMISRHVQNKPMAPCLQWKKNEKTVIHLIDRKTGKPVKKYFADPFFFLHIINQYEEDGHLILDICCYRDATMLDCMYIQALQDASQNIDYCEMFRGRPLRFVLPLSIPFNYKSWGTNLVSLRGTTASAYAFLDKTVFVCPELLCDLGCETPRIYYERYMGKPYRYFYAISSDVDMENPGTLIKVDTRTKSCQTWCEDHVFPSEPVFVSSPKPQSEDDGVILSVLLWTGGYDNKVGLLILDAKTWTELGRATFFTPTPVPKCLHGWFKPSLNKTL
ncbi:carotenoid isomerooxygenase [Nilaparvata lugens]|uniref:carotenoid isomerooxygenase n=1 Tax=Nilaparvata lugens TaxID=108931 RepID=UPI00193DB1FC|nr:carotenoid isomerooxygenase [Nilaparvata lugens]